MCVYVSTEPSTKRRMSDVSRNGAGQLQAPGGASRSVSVVNRAVAVAHGVVAFLKIVFDLIIETYVL